MNNKIGKQDNILNNKLPYKNMDLSFEERAADLVSRMTLEEKASQMSNIASAIPRLGVSGYNYWREGLHGVARQGKATSFPTSLAMSNTWNRELVFKMADITSTEARGKNPKTNLSYWSPTVNLARDPRWGRNEETFGEDPYLTSQLGIEFVNGMQGDDEKYLKTIATIKHFVANNCEKERRNGTSVMDERTLREYYAKVFKDIVEEANPASAMTSYNATTITRDGEILYDYIPSSANSYLLKDQLRRNWGFDGYITGDCGAFEDLESKPAYKTALFPNEDINEIPQSATIVKAFLAGADTDCGNAAVQESVLQAVEKEYISENELNINLYNLFLQRMRTGEFDIDARYSDITKDVLEIDEHVAVAETAAEESWVLLKNEDNILPLNKDIKRIALVGPLADEVFLGDYSGSPDKTKKPYYGIYEELKKTNPGVELKYLGGLTDELELFNLESLIFILDDGSTREVDIGAATGVSGVDFDGKIMKSVTRVGVAILPSVDCSSVRYVKASIATGGFLGGSLEISYGKGGSNIASISSQPTDSINEYTECVCDYTGHTGGYSETADLYLTFKPKDKTFVIDEYRDELDKADVIIAYAGTTLDDSKEGEDRTEIKLPISQSHVDAITKAYPNKSIAVAQTVGQIDVSTFENGAKAILWTSYNGQTQGTALGKILTGEANPSGRLTSTWYDSEGLKKLLVGTDGETGDDGIVRYYNDYSIRSSEEFMGRTYQYYKGEPKYPFGYGLSYTNFEYSDMKISSENVDVNSVVTVSVCVKNTGACAGAEVVQMYVSAPQVDGENIPKKQLRGFEKVALGVGETATVKFDLKVSDMTFYDEKLEKIYVMSGEYKVMVSKDASDNELIKTFNVNGELDYKLKTVCALPNGIIVEGLISQDGKNLEIISGLNPNLSAVMTDETIFDLSYATVKYESENKEIAYVNSEGLIVSGTETGVTTINITVTIDDVKKTTSFPVINRLYIKAEDKDKLYSKQLIKAELGACEPKLYSEPNLKKLNDICDSALNRIENITKLDELKTQVHNAVLGIRRIPMDNFDLKYKIYSENPEHIKHYIIDSEIEKIKLYADDNGSLVDVSSLKWQVEKLDNSNREVASIDSETGELTVLGSGLVKISVINKSELAKGELIVYVNLEINPSEKENNSSWIKFSGVNLDNLKQIRISYRSDFDDVIMIASVEKTTNIDSFLGRTIAKKTDSSSQSANETVIDVDSMVVIKNTKKDENGIGTIYIKSDSAIINSLKLVYDEIDEQTPYKFLSVNNEKDGSITANVNYVGSDIKPEAVIASSRYRNGELQGDVKVTRIDGAGSYVLDLGASVGDEIRLVVLDNLDDMKQVSEKAVKTYCEPVDNEVVVYSLTNPAYGTLLSKADAEVFPEINGLTGYGRFVTKKSEKFDYNYNGKIYTLSKAWQGTKGDESKQCLYFKPKSKCIVTVLFNGNGGNNRVQYIAQNGNKLALGFSKKNQITVISTMITDTTTPVYTYGEVDNKNIYAIIVEYLNGNVEATLETTLHSVKWNGGYARLTKNNKTGETKVSTSARGTVWNDLSTEYFAQSDIETDNNTEFKINCLATYKDRLYAGCDGGLVIVFSSCHKCHVLKRVCKDNINNMDISGDYMTINDGERSIPMSKIGGDEIEIEEALILYENGAIFVDVREKDEYKKKQFNDSVNIPVEEIKDGLNGYDRKTTIIFCCTMGGRSDLALRKARKMGFKKIYNLGNFEKIL